jgi:hypothetical protein
VEDGLCESIQSYDSVLCAHAQLRTGAGVLRTSGVFCTAGWTSARTSGRLPLEPPFAAFDESYFMIFPVRFAPNARQSCPATSSREDATMSSEKRSKAATEV